MVAATAGYPAAFAVAAVLVLAALPLCSERSVTDSWPSRTRRWLARPIPPCSTSSAAHRLDLAPAYPDAQLGVEASMLGPDARYERDFGALNLISISPNGRRRFRSPARPDPRQHRPGRRVAAGLQAALRGAFGHLDGAVRDVLAELVVILLWVSWRTPTSGEIWQQPRCDSPALVTKQR